MMIIPALVAAKNNHSLSKLGYEIPEHLPSLETMDELRPQSAANVARRSAVLTHFVMIGFDCPAPKVAAAIAEHQLFEFTSEYEQKLLVSEVGKQDRINCTWLTECLQAIAWCLSNSILQFDKYCDDDLYTKFPEPFTDPSKFIKKSKLRPFEEIYSMADLYYRYHWLSRHGQQLDLSESAIRERRRTLDWVIGTEQSWDDVALDT